MWHENHISTLEGFHFGFLFLDHQISLLSGSYPFSVTSRDIIALEFNNNNNKKEFKNATLTA